MSRLRHVLPFLNWPVPTLALWRGECLAGISVGLMLIPQAVAYSALAGMPLITGIYAALWPALIAVLFSSSQRLSVGPTALTATLVYSSLLGMAEPGSAAWVNLAVWLCLMSGGLQLLLGLVRFGWLLNLVSSPVLTGFTQAAALFIVSTQIPAQLGMTGGWANAFSPAQWQMPALAMGVGSLALLMWLKRLRPTFPGVLVLVGFSAWLSVWLGLPDQPGLTVGALPQGLPEPYFPSVLTWEAYKSLLVPTLAITFVSFMETASSAKVDNDQAGKTWNQDQDLIGQGLGKIAAGLCGGFPTSSSFSRSALNLYAGAQTAWATVVSVVVICFGLLYLTPVLESVPQSALAAVVVAAVLGLIKPRQLWQIYRVNRVEAYTAGATLVVTLVLAPQLYWGVLVGLFFALSHFLYLRMHPRIIEVGLHPDGSLRDRHLWHLPPLAQTVYALRMDAALDFATASAFEKNILQAIESDQKIEHICIFAISTNRIDVTGVETIARLEKLLCQRGIALHISGLKLPVERTLKVAGCLKAGTHLVLYRTDADAIQALWDLSVRN